MPTPTLSSFQDVARNAQGQCIPGATVAVLSGQTDTVNTATQPGSPLATIYTDPYGNSQVPQAGPLALAGTGQSSAGSTNVNWVSGNYFSEWMEGQIFILNSVQYTVADVAENGLSLTLTANAQSTGTFAFTCTVPQQFITTDDQGNFQYWTNPGYYVNQIYGASIQQGFQSVIGVSIGGGGGGGGSGTVGFGNGTALTEVTTTQLGTGTGPLNPYTVIGYQQITIGAATYWVPLFQ